MGDFRFSLSTATSPPIGGSLVSVSLSVALGFSLSRWLSSATSLSVSLSTLLWFLSLDSSLVSLSRRRLLFPSVDLWFLSLSLSVALPLTATELPLGVSPRSTTARDGQLSRWLSSDRKKELEVKERLSKMSILNSLIAKKEPVADYEEALKKKFISEDKVKTVSRSGAIRITAFVKELEVKERLSKMSILDSLIAKKEPVADYEEALKKKFISEDKVKTVSRSGAIRITAFVVFGVLCHVVSVSRQYHGVE
ncbi:hypothetical protein DY000_02051087 [Brassica cretica]|uniref:Uncharacterized protein n=1 Tax=Brassica cretica TaxID=69181 RepID=A0ABQ7ESZ5_BRACR|nr:hypothetical protein DY000_02051087 [Brassica cretica]